MQGAAYSLPASWKSDVRSVTIRPAPPGTHRVSDWSGMRQGKGMGSELRRHSRLLSGDTAGTAEIMGSR